MPYDKISDAPEWVRKKGDAAARQWIAAFNSALKQYKDEQKAFAVAAAAVNKRSVSEVVLAEWDTAYINDLPDSAFAYIEPGGDKDDEGKTVPRSKRHLPYKNSSGKPDAAHARNALVRLEQTDIPDAAKSKAKSKLEAAAKGLGIDVAASESIRFTIAMPAPSVFGEQYARGEIIREGSWAYGGEEMDITPEKIQQAYDNWKTHQRDVMLDYNHGSRLGKTPEEQKRAGDLVDLELVEVDGKKALVGKFKPTDEATSYLNNGEYKYLSAEFEEDYFHPEDKDWIGMYLQAVALTNRPFIEGMAPIVLMGEGTKALLTQHGMEEMAKKIAGMIKEDGHDPEKVMNMVMDMMKQDHKPMMMELKKLEEKQIEAPKAEPLDVLFAEAVPDGTLTKETAEWLSGLRENGLAFLRTPQTSR